MKKELEKETGGGSPGTTATMVAAVAVVTLLAYLPTLKYGFVNWDDPTYIYNNSLIRSIDADFFRRVFTEPFFSNWHPLTIISYAVDHMIWGLNPMGYHLTNIVFHAANAGIVTLLTVSLIKTLRGSVRPATSGAALPAAFSAGILFGLHPLHVESVAWISERKDVLSAFFFLLSILAYVSYTRKDDYKKYALSLVLFVLALMSKPMAISLPVVLLILDFHPLGRLARKGTWQGCTRARVLLEKIPFFALSVACSALTMWAQRGSISTADVVGTAPRILLALRAYAFYIYKTVLPVGLAPFYPHPLRVEYTSAEYLGSIALLVAFTVVCIFLFKKQKLYTAVWVYYIITLAPVIGFVQIGTQAAADRYMYLPSVALFILAGIGVGALSKRFGAKAAVPVVVVASIILAALAMKQSMIWKDSITLWSYEIEYLEQRPTDVKIVEFGGRKIRYAPALTAYYNRAKAYDIRGDYVSSIQDYHKVVTQKPGYRNAYVNRGVAYAKSGRYGLAIEDFTRAISLDANDADVYYNRAQAYALLGERERAERDRAVAQRLERGR